MFVYNCTLEEKIGTVEIVQTFEILKVYEKDRNSDCKELCAPENFSFLAQVQVFCKKSNNLLCKETTPVA